MSRSTKRMVLIIVDLLMIFLALLTSSMFSEAFTVITSRFFVVSWLIISLVYLILARYLHVFSVLTRYTSSSTLLTIGLSLAGAHLALVAYSLSILGQLSCRFILLSLLFSFLYIITPRMLWRTLSERERYGKSSQRTVRTLLVGAGAGGHLFLSTLSGNHSDIEIIGIIDQDRNKKGTYIQGKKVLGDVEDIPHLVQEYSIEQVTIAIPSLTKEARQKLVDICHLAGVTVNSMPNVEDIILGKVSTSSLREIDIADLLGRDEVVLEQESLNAYFSGKTILVTGAGGSIGSEICRQIAKFSPKQLLLLGHGENSIYLIHQELVNKYGQVIDIVPLIADIQDRELIAELLAAYRPQVVYHAAAHKHVPLMEYNPKEAVKNNIFGTKNVAEAAKAARVEKFVMVSTDKAVNPPNVMGATKRVAEMIVTNLNEAGQTQFSAVRFGNVLGSRGSVVPLFKRQIASGGPVTVTDFRMTRYFMTIPEASRLVIQAGHLAKGGEIFVLDMGDPVLIKDLATKVIKLSGHTVEEIGIVETGIRPGEKLYEELLSSEERISQQVYDKIFVGRVQNQSPAIVQTFVDSLLTLPEDELKRQLVDFARQE
ncbi:polysaccharide biosynthesis protein [Streptococcus sp. E17BB]|uniref:polysaccharide biosynthesis protein n=1 Tax=Streptococcus sp. E17BB TaxID=3278714 RepID=UPI00359CEFDD